MGDVAKFIIQNPYPHAKALISIERGRIFSYEVVDISQSIYEYSFPVTEEYAPNVYASVVLLSPGPEVKFGQTQFTVDRAEKKLTIVIHADKSSYMPGEKVNLTITATDKQSRPVEADVSVAVADLSVLALKGNPKKDPLIFFYDGFPLTVTTETNVKNLLEETPIPTGTKGGDGGNPADLSKRKRGEFKDTAFWKADVVTNESGVAQVSFTLPDNLTKWQVETVGITKDTKLGVGYQELAAQKDVMTVPIAPRFIIPGDTFMIGAKIFNQTKNDQPLEISLQSPSLKIDGSGHTQKTIKAGETTTVYFNVTAPLGVTKGAHAYTLSAHNQAYNDTVSQSLPITQNMTYESTATAGSTHAPSTAEYLYVPDSVLLDRGGLTIKTSATLAVYLSDAIQYLFAYPYGCSEQLASRLSAIAITKRAVSIPNVGSQFKIPAIEFNGVSYTVDQAVDMGLSQIYDNQTVDGGFSYYKGLRADPYLTVQVLSSLSDIKEAGYTVRPQVITSATQYLAGQVSYFKTHSDTDSLILLAYVLSRVNPQLAPDITSLITKKYLEDTASSNALGYLALLASNGGTTKALKETIFSTLTNRVDIDSRGAYVKSSQSTGSRTDFETPEKDTALFLKALVADHRDYTETDNIIRWLLASRSSDGSWGSTNTSVAAIDSLSQYLIWKKETESSFTLATTLDGKNFVTTTFAKQNILSTIQSFLPISQITPNTLHSLTFSKTDNNTFLNTFYYDLSLKYYLPVNKIAPRDEGMAITREMYSLTDTKNAHPLTEAKVGDVVRGVLTLVVPKERRLFSIEDYIPAGFELINFDLATEDQTSQTAPDGASGKDANSTFATSNTAQYSIVSLFTRVAHDLSGASLFFGDTSKDTSVNPLVTYQKFYPDFKELRDDRLFLFAQEVQPGTYTYEYYLRATTPGIFSHLPAIASELYFPENFGRTAGSFFTVTQ